MFTGPSTPDSSSSTDRPRRATVLREVVRVANTRCDGVLPMDVAGVADTFPEPADLVAALHLRWHTALSGAIEAALADQPLDLEHAVLCAWRRTARDLTGVRLVLDRFAEQATEESSRAMVVKATRSDWRLLAVSAGQAGLQDPEAAEVGEVLELLARATFDPSANPAPRLTRSTGGDRPTRRLVAA